MANINQFKKNLLLIAGIVVSVLFFSCSSLEVYREIPHGTSEFIQVTVNNNTNEEIAVMPGRFWFISLFLPDEITHFKIPRGMSLNVAVRRDELITGYGTSSGNNYNSQTYYRDYETWAVR